MSPNVLRRRPSADPVHRPSLIVPRLYLSDLSTALDSALLAHLGITHVVSIIESAPRFPDSMKSIKKLHIRLIDSPVSNLIITLPKTTAFIRNALSENPDNKVLVHCFLGVSRSAAVVSAYLIATTEMTACEAVNFVRGKRPIINPNSGFLAQLEEYATCFYHNDPKHPAKTLGKNIADRLRRFRQPAAPVTNHT